MGKPSKSFLESILQDTIREINFSGIITTVSGKRFFLKSGNISPTYRCEASGLKELANANVIHVAKIVAAGDDYILTEYIERGYKTTEFYKDFGKKIAELHKKQASSFGFYENNFIGASPQINIADSGEEKDWVSFFFNKRLLFQYRMAEKNALVSSTLRSGFTRLEGVIPDLLKDSLEPPTLLHGDLWSGNYICNTSGEVVLIDPAVYYGHREADLAMTHVFGGFPPDFYESYQTEHPLKNGWKRREPVYKLYHILNHLNIFGQSYLSEAEYLIKSIIY